MRTQINLLIDLPYCLFAGNFKNSGIATSLSRELFQYKSNFLGRILQKIISTNNFDILCINCQNNCDSKQRVSSGYFVGDRLNYDIGNDNNKKHWVLVRFFPPEAPLDGVCVPHKVKDRQSNDDLTC